MWLSQPKWLAESAQVARGGLHSMSFPPLKNHYGRYKWASQRDNVCLHFHLQPNSHASPFPRTHHFVWPNSRHPFVFYPHLLFFFFFWLFKETYYSLDYLNSNVAIKIKIISLADVWWGVKNLLNVFC